MKTIFILFSVLIGSVAFGESLISQGTYVCRIQNSDQTLTLVKIRDLALPQNSNLESKARYSLQLQTTELPFPSLEAQGIVTIAEVQLNFKSDDGRYSVQMYLNDSAGVLTRDGQERRFNECVYF